MALSSSHFPARGPQTPKNLDTAAIKRHAEIHSMSDVFMKNWLNVLFSSDFRAHGATVASEVPKGKRVMRWGQRFVQPTVVKTPELQMPFLPLVRNARTYIFTPIFCLPPFPHRVSPVEKLQAGKMGNLARRYKSWWILTMTTCPVNSLCIFIWICQI